MKAIETNYDGYQFRSRLEARWAVFFNNLSVKYEYEPEGFYVDDRKYLPDFWLPHLDLWVEIKGRYTKDAAKLTQKFSEGSKWPIVLIVGTPGKERILFFGHEICVSGGGPYCRTVKWCISKNTLTLDLNDTRDDRMITNSEWEPMPQFMYSRDYGIQSNTRLLTAYKAARSARFEFGQSGSPKEWVQ